MKKRILFCIENFQHGGINKALENLLAVFDHQSYDVGVFVVNQEDGPYKEIFTPYLKYPADRRLEAYCTYLQKHHGLRKLSLFMLKFYRKAIAKLGRDPFRTRLSRWAKRIAADNYDCVIAYAEGYITDFVSSIEGKKIAWIHIDYKRYLSYMKHPDERCIYSQFNYIVIPSKFSAKSFVEVYSQLSDRVRVVPNVIDSSMVRRGALTGEPLDSLFIADEFNIISVGRVCYEKRFFEIPSIARQLKDKGMRFRWHIIGDGSDVEVATLNNAITENAVEDCVIPLGRKSNPYPYIAKSDLLVSTSLSETFSYVVFEAKSLGVPVVCADFGTAPEILPPQHGVISSIENMALAIYGLFSDYNTYQLLKSKLANYNYDSLSTMSNLYKII